MKRLAIVIIGMAILSGCSTNVVPRYSIEADNTMALRQIEEGDIAVGDFSGPAIFYDTCRYGSKVAPPDGVTFAAYIKEAIADELKIAGLYDDNQSPRIIITGKVEALYFSSITIGEWNISLSLYSSNGASMYVTEHHKVDISGVPFGACTKVAAAFPDAVQNLIRKIVSSGEFKSLVM